MIASIDSSSATACGLVAENKSSSAVVQQPPWHTIFLRLVPRIRQHSQIRFRHVNPADREDAVQEVIARSLVQFLRLLELGKEHLIFAGPLARYAVAQGSWRTTRRWPTQYPRRVVTILPSPQRRVARIFGSLGRGTRSMAGSPSRRSAGYAGRHCGLPHRRTRVVPNVASTQPPFGRTAGYRRVDQRRGADVRNFAVACESAAP